MTTANEVADYLIALAHKRGEEVNNLKLQRLLYYAQAWHLGVHGEPLFPEKFRAWMSGPVIPDLFWRFDEFGIDSIPPQGNAAGLSADVTLFLDQVADEYMPLDEYHLSQLARSEFPWRNVREGLDDGEGCETELDEADIRIYFHYRAHESRVGRAMFALLTRGTPCRPKRGDAPAHRITAGDAAAYLLKLAQERGEAVNNLKLQRLLYYAQAWHLGLFGAPLFPEKFEAWMTGPLIPELYWRFKPHGIRPIAEPASVPELPCVAAEFLKTIADDYLAIDEYHLDEMTTSEAPWLAARAGLDRGDPSQNEISEDEMRVYFQSLAAAA